MSASINTASWKAPQFHSLTPYMAVPDCKSALAFYAKAFDAKEKLVLTSPADSTKICHAEIIIGDSVIMLSDECPEMKHFSAAQYKGSPISFMIYVPDVDSTIQKAVKAGATLEKEVKDMFYGDRSGGIKDPFGISWSVSTHVREVSKEECDLAMKNMKCDATNPKDNTGANCQNGTK